MVALGLVLVSLLPLLAVAYPLFRRTRRESPQEESRDGELRRRWNAAVASLRSAELDRGLGNLSEQEYRRLRQENLEEAAAALKGLDVERGEHAAALAEQATETGGDPVAHSELAAPAACLGCGMESPVVVESCPGCGASLLPGTARQEE